MGGGMGESIGEGALLIMEGGGWEERECKRTRCVWEERGERREGGWGRRRKRVGGSLLCP